MMVKYKKNEGNIYEQKQIYNFIKRIIDVAGAIVGLIVFSPIFLFVALAIKLEDPKGKVLFSQERNGKNGEIFNMYKFRSMVHNAEELKSTLVEQNEMDGPVFKIKDDPRITKVGKFIRKTSLDELPQIINVLTGEMSIVGPRPPIPEEVKQYNEYQKQRLLVKPGITCYWQVSGRNNLSFDEWIELDLKYIRDRSILLDFKLILMTIPCLLGDKNAS